jgi:transglutaminase-like putative cysteine protease
MKKLVIIFAAVISLQQAIAQSYAVLFIKDSLLKGANAVIRSEDTRYELKDLDKAIFKYKRAITILNDYGERHAGMHLPYDRLHSIDNFEGTLYDAMGKKIRSLKKSEIKDHTGSSEGNLADDNRYKSHSFYHSVYPYTVEYEYQLTYKQTLFFPQWQPQEYSFVSVEQSTFTMVLPTNYQLRYRAFNYPAPPQTTQQGDKTTYQWTANNLRAERVGYAFPGWRHVTPMVMFAPSDFQIDKYKGNLNTWSDLGKFQLQLNQGRDVLPDEIKQQVQSLVSGKQTAREKVEVLYDFLQKNTRYISIQLGVGGWQPFDASYVAKNRYGDCKALSNYMHSLLKEAGIPSYYTIIQSGEDEEDVVGDFPNNMFNHVILCVPMDKDSIWLECTSPVPPAGYMGSSTGNRHAMLVTPEGGKLVRTPTYGVKENWQVMKVKAVLDETGNLTLEQNARYSGMTQDAYAGTISYMAKDKLKELLNEIIDLPTYDIVDFNYTYERKTVPVVNEQLKLAVSNYGQITGKRLFVTPNITNRSTTKLSSDARRYPIRLTTAQAETDSVEIVIPGGYAPESVPESMTVQSRFGKYQVNYKVEANRILYHRKLEVYDGFFDKGLYDELVKFHDQVYKADRSRIVLVKM